MIKLLHIENIAVIEKADIEFDFGLNVLTGETGAGKSIVIDALSAVTGGRTSRDIIRTGADFATVTAVFSCEDEDASWLADNDIEADESGDIYISRRISSDGKTVCRINGAPIPVTQLRELGTGLLDIHGQNDGRKLLDESAHRSYLDTFGGLASQLGEYRGIYDKLIAKKHEIEKLNMDEGDKERRIDELKYQIDEIEQARIRVGEHDELSSRRELLMNASRLTESVEAAFEALNGGDSSEGAVALITEAQMELDKAARYSEGLRSIGERLTDLRYNAQDISDELRSFRSELDFFPGELDELESRLDAINRIMRKYGSEEAAIEYLEQGKIELMDMEDSSNKLERLSAELEQLINEASAVSEKLSQSRKSAAKQLENNVMEELSQLNMPGVEFVVEFGEVHGEYGLGAAGQDEISFLMSANPGEKPGKINRIASGGELARIMLALKNVIGSGKDTGAVVFDEIDSGVSGIAAQRVGEKLSKLAQQRQVLCVTHLPQIAVMADTHFEILKSTSSGRTFTQVNELDHEGRKAELARLSGGENITTTTLNSAAEQLAAAERFKETLKEN
ncbi:MAG: DNA repair protein RecN [Oscillospiraceae bacterium]|nr:DNA repair protein RecN [Oscillospiraceae bacterium]